MKILCSCFHVIHIDICNVCLCWKHLKTQTCLISFPIFQYMQMVALLYQISALTLLWLTTTKNTTIRATNPDNLSSPILIGMLAPWRRVFLRALLFYFLILFYFLFWIADWSECTAGCIPSLHRFPGFNRLQTPSVFGCCAAELVSGSFSTVPVKTCGCYCIMILL